MRIKSNIAVTGKDKHSNYCKMRILYTYKSILDGNIRLYFTSDGLDYKILLPLLKQTLISLFPTVLQCNPYSLSAFGQLHNDILLFLKYSITGLQDKSFL